MLVASMIVGVATWITANDAEAADVQTVADFVSMNTADYWSDAEGAEKRIAPEHPTKVGYLFGGWYESATDTTAYTAEEMKSVTTAYAKFVPAQVLSVKSQVTDGTTVESSSTSIRVVSAVDSNQYSQVGFDIKATKDDGTTKTWGKPATKVYTKFNSAEGAKTAEQIFGEPAEYFFAYQINKVPNNDANGAKQKDFDTSFLATPYWVTMDGTKVEGLAKYVHVEDSYLNLISIPVYLKSSDVEAAAGILSLTYNSNSMTYKDCKNGTLFEEGMAADQGNGVVKCVANVEKLEDKPANGMFINLRFQLKDAAVKAEETLGYTFDVTAAASDFCDIKEVLISEKSQTIKAWDIYY